MATMPGPVGLPRERVTPEVSACRRMPIKRRPVSTATRAWPPSWLMVTTCRVSDQARGMSTRASAARATAITTAGSGAGWVAVARSQI